MTKRNAFKSSMFDDQLPDYQAAFVEDKSAHRDQTYKSGMSNYSKTSRKPETEEDQIRKLYEAIDDKMRGQGLSKLVEDSIRSQMFGVFADHYREWQNMSMPSDYITNFFAGSDILAGSGNIAIFRALLYFNLPHNIVFKPVTPVKVFSK